MSTEKEIPILFSTPMVKAILEGSKTMTRRIFKGTGIVGQKFTVNSPDEELIELSENELRDNGTINYKSVGGLSGPYKCPYGKPGDILWVREAFGLVDFGGGESCYVYKAGFDEDEAPMGYPEMFFGWKPSIHMPKSAARIWLEVTDVRVERLQEISEGDAVFEGVESNACKDPKSCPSSDCKDGCQAIGEYFHYKRGLDDFPAYSAVESFESLWQKINGEESWNQNPWVWVISFKVLSTTGKPDSITSKPHIKP